MCSQLIGLLSHMCSHQAVVEDLVQSNAAAYLLRMIVVRNGAPGPDMWREGYADNRAATYQGRGGH